MIKINEKVPEFELEAFQDKKIKKIKLSNYLGKWLVLLFYPADFTFVCPTELSEAAKNYDKFEKINTEVVSVSTDTAFVHKAWHDESPMIGEIKYPMAADPTSRVCRSFGTYIDSEGLSLRATFIIDPKGILKAMEMHDNSIGRNTEEILRKLQAAQHVYTHKNEVCPASWKPGAKTLKPGLDLVGKL